jgi:hypothetical protein
MAQTSEIVEVAQITEAGPMEAVEDRVWSLIVAADIYTDNDAVVANALALAEEHGVAAVTDAVIQSLIETHGRDRKNRCVECGVDMGEMNPRQLCCKVYCENAFC